ncbi:MAG: SUMF1/EgtB/PvdO family nonheme iron enzyme [Nitrospinae bacterium]|nr:SUMF1/EgtB/PvdO family nonheme iron enzyme [Nitrospinota bacterium]
MRVKPAILAWTLIAFSFSVLSGFCMAEAQEQLQTGTMVPVKGGCFDMGDQFNIGDDDEKPVHNVCLDDFRMDTREVTQAEFEALMGKNPSANEDCPDCPVEMVTWFEAKEYCEKSGKRLPTEAEWEYSAREGGKKIWYGNGKNELKKGEANFASRATKPVGLYPPNALGLYDMAGNVWEWVADWHSHDYNEYKGATTKNPTGATRGINRVARGGAWGLIDKLSRASARNPIPPASRFNSVGFRCVK